MQGLGKVLYRLTIAALLLTPMIASAQRSDPIVGTWNLTGSIKGSTIFIGVMTFHADRTATEFDTDGNNASAYESMDLGDWRKQVDGTYKFKAENYGYDSSGKLSQLQVVGCKLSLGTNHHDFKGDCTVKFYSCSLTECPGSLVESFTFQLRAKRF